MKLLFFLLQFFTSQLISSFSITTGPKCRPDESSALLKLKASLPTSPDPLCLFIDIDGASINPYTKTSNWNESTNCCTWTGVTCHNVSGHVIGLNLTCGGVSGAITSKSSLFSLVHLQRLDLSLNDLKGSSIVPEFGRFKNLTHLDLNNCKFRGEIPENIFLLPKLEVLSLYYNLELTGHFPNSKYNWTSSLRELDLSYTGLSIDLTRLLVNGRSIFDLSLVECHFVGSFPMLVGNFSHLVSLNLMYNGFGGSLPLSSFDFKRIRSLDLSFNNFIGPIPNVDIVNSSSLAILKISNNSLNGTIPSWLYQLPYLSDLDLSNNKILGEIGEFRSKSLTSLSLGQNKLNGAVPRSIFQNVGLKTLDLSSNSLKGNVELKELSELKEISYLDLSFNNLSLRTDNSMNYTLPRLVTLALSSCNIIGEFPDFFRSSKNLVRLDLSSNKIQGIVPKWLWDIGKDSLLNLNLSLNSLTFMEPLPWDNLHTLDLRSNFFSGPIPISSAPVLQILLGSKNQFWGKISTSFCTMTLLMVLDLSYNNLTGKIPPCFGSFSESLSVLDLRRNRLHGNIPAEFSKENSLRNLNLNGNRLDGTLPRSLMNCTGLEVLDVGNNRLNDTFPNWIESLPELRVLVLRSNRFHGPVENNPKTRFLFRELRIMDLSDNKFNGALPNKLFKNFKAMMNTENVKMGYMGEDYYQDSVMVTMKGYNIELVKIQTILTTIDFSCNDFTGDIPSLMGRLKSLKGLNFSNNMLSGTIPSTLGNLSNLEWLDLSSNRLVGGIPLELVGIRWLSFLNLSHNLLVGPIPHGSQFNTFGNDSFGKNLDLCGFPLSKLCNEDAEVTPSSDEEDDDSNWLGWKIVFMGFACGIVIGISSGYILLYSDGKLSWLSESVLVELALFSRKCQAFFRKLPKKEEKKKRVVGSLRR